jgi:hypothetical protein
MHDFRPVPKKKSDYDNFLSHKMTESSPLQMQIDKKDEVTRKIGVNHLDPILENENA